ncbi:3D domain-containing protein, partial [Vibrio vulnificus]|uniref:3D domain-containing protein n=1 Tax=Vibrio vulnificus TaxID=672 RepID=UPI001CA5966A
MGAPLIKKKNVAIDRKVIPLGSLMWLSTTRPDDGSAVVRPVAAQDTGGALGGGGPPGLFSG